MVSVLPNGQRSTHRFDTQKQATRFVKAYTRTARDTDATAHALIDGDYTLDLERRGNRLSTRQRTLRHLHLLPDAHLDAFDIQAAQAWYDDLCDKYSVDTHRNALARAKAFFTWARKQGYVRRNPFDDVEPVGRRKKGKEQLRKHEAQAWLRVAEREAQRNTRTVAAMMTLLMGMRAGEICALRVRDVDDSVLWISDSKTEAGRRRLVIPERLRAHLRRVTAGKDGEAPLFPGKSTDGTLNITTVSKEVMRICRLARVPEVGAHSMRGLHATLATSAGAVSGDVSRALGHTSPAVTNAHYTKPEAHQEASARKVEAALEDELLQTLKRAAELSSGRVRELIEEAIEACVAA